MPMKMTPRPSANDVAYIDKGVFAYLMDILEPAPTTFCSPHAEFIRNEVLKEITRKIKWAIQPA